MIKRGRLSLAITVTYQVSWYELLTRIASLMALSSWFYVQRSAMLMTAANKFPRKEITPNWQVWVLAHGILLVGSAGSGSVKSHITIWPLHLARGTDKCYFLSVKTTFGMFPRDLWSGMDSVMNWIGIDAKNEWIGMEFNWKTYFWIGIDLELISK